MSDPKNPGQQEDAAIASKEIQPSETDPLEIQELIDFSFNEVTLVKRLSRSCLACS